MNTNYNQLILNQNSRSYFIEQLLGINNYLIKKGLKKKLKRKINNWVYNKYKKNNNIYKLFTWKMDQHRVPLKFLAKRKSKKSKKRYFLKRQRERFIPYLANTIFEKSLKKLKKKRWDYIIFLNLKEQELETKKYISNTIKADKKNKNNFIKLFDSKITTFLSSEPKINIKFSGFFKYIFWRIIHIYKLLVKKKKKQTLQIKHIYLKWQNKVNKKNKYILKDFSLKKNKYYYFLNNLNNNVTLLKKINYTKQLRFYSQKLDNNLCVINLNIKSTELFTLLGFKKQLKNFFWVKNKYNLKVSNIKKNFKKVTVLKSPHVNKTARSQYEEVLYSLNIKISFLKKDFLKIYKFLLYLKQKFSFFDFVIKTKI